MEDPAEHRNRTLAEWRPRLSVNEGMTITASLEGTPEPRARWKKAPRAARTRGRLPQGRQTFLP